MRRPVALLPILALALAAPPPAHATKGSKWQRVLREHDIRRVSSEITVRPGRIGRSTVSVVVRARETNTEPVLFQDALYGATAWRYRKGRWRRIDSAQVRPAVVRELEPGERTQVRLPLRRRAKRIRVLVPVAAERSGRWVDVTD